MIYAKGWMFLFGGSQSRGWNPHTHAPCTHGNDLFGDNCEGYLNAIDDASPVVEVLGITDYLTIEPYNAVVATLMTAIVGVSGNQWQLANNSTMLRFQFSHYDGQRRALSKSISVRNQNVERSNTRFI